MMNRIVRGGLPLLASLIVAAVFLWLLFRDVDYGNLRGLLLGVSPHFILLALSLLAADYAIRVVRWWWMLRRLVPEIAPGQCVWPYLSSIAVNNVLPFRAGDLLRVFGFHRQLGTGASQLFGLLLIERFFDLLTLLLFLFIGLQGLSEIALPHSLYLMACLLAASGAAVLILTVYLSGRHGLQQDDHDSAAAAAASLGQSWMTKLRGQFMLFAATIRIFAQAGRLAMLFGLSLGAWVLEGAVFAAVAAGLSANPAPPLAAWFSMATGTLATLIPSSPGYLGTFDYFTALELVSHGIDKEIAVAFSIIVHIVIWGPLTVIGLSYLAMFGIRR